MEVLGREEGWKGERILSIEVWEVLFFCMFLFFRLFVFSTFCFSPALDTHNLFHLSLYHKVLCVWTCLYSSFNRTINYSRHLGANN